MSLVSVTGLQASSLSPVCEVCEAASGAHRNSVEKRAKVNTSTGFSDSEFLHVSSL